MCNHCATHCANLLADGKKEHLSCLMHCRDCATCCAACSQVCASGGPLSAVMADCCAKCCDHCAKACEAFPNDMHMKSCAEECRKCEKSCKAIAKWQNRVRFRPYPVSRRTWLVKLFSRLRSGVLRRHIEDRMSRMCHANKTDDITERADKF